MIDRPNLNGSASDGAAGTAKEQFFLNATLGLNHWWRWILGIVIIVVIWLGVGSIGLALAGCQLLHGTGLLGLDCSGGEFAGDGAFSAQLVIFGLGFAVGLLGIWLVLKFIHRKEFSRLLTGRERFDYTRFSVGMLNALVLLLVMLAIDVYVLGSDTTFQQPGWGFLIFLLFALIFVPIQSGYEEVFFRGYILHGLIQLTRNRAVLAIIAGVLFALPHMTNPEPGAIGIAPYLSSLVASGIFFAAVVLLDGGLELAWGYHFVNNFFLGVIANTDVSPLTTPSLLIVHFDGYDLFPHVLIDIVGFVVAILVLNIRYRWFSLSPR